MRNARDDHGELGRERFLEARPHAVEILGLREIERPDDAVDHRNRYLKAQTGRQDSFLAQRVKDEIGADRVARIAEACSGIAEAYALDPRPDAELPRIIAAARQELLDAVDRLWPLQGLEIGMAVEDQIAEAIDPGAALADLAIGQRRQIGAESAAEAAHHLLDRVERHAADKKKLFAHRLGLPTGCAVSRGDQ